MYLGAELAQGDVLAWGVYFAGECVVGDAMTFEEIISRIKYQPFYRDGDVVIYNENCLEVMRQIPNKKVHLVMTDPPYGHNNNNGDLIQNWEKALGKNPIRGGDRARPIANDGVEANDLVQKCFSEFGRILGEGCCCCCCGGGGGPDPQFARWSLWLDKEIPFKQMIVWDKGPMGMGWHYRRSYETILVAQKPGTCKWYDKSDKIENIIRPGYKGIRKIIPSKDQHPTPKPEGLFKHFIELHTQPGDIVIDPFLGGGTCAVACKELGRKFIGCEVSLEFCQMSKKSLAQEYLFCGG